MMNEKKVFPYAYLSALVDTDISIHCIVVSLSDAVGRVQPPLSQYDRCFFLRKKKAGLMLKGGRSILFNGVDRHFLC